jgi:hypothetical protein
MEAKQLQLSSFASITDINPTTLAHILRGRGKEKLAQMPSTDVLRKIIATFPDVNAEWLLVGSGAMYKSKNGFIEPDLFPVETAVKPTNLPDPLEKRQEIELKPVEKEVILPQKQTLNPEISLSENIDKIMIFFKNKTFVTLKPEE